VPPVGRAARGFVSDALRALSATDAEIEAFGLSVSELGSNAVMHARRSEWTVGIEADDEWYTMDVSGGTAAPDNVIFHPEQWAIAESGEPTGRGLGIVHGLMDDVTVEMHRGSVRVVCRLRRSHPSPTHSE
jgi:anti-sigma regulatory factor (Ser/Thr protein kinase)